MLRSVALFNLPSAMILRIILYQPTAQAAKNYHACIHQTLNSPMKKLYAIMMLCATALSPLYAQTGDTTEAEATVSQPSVWKYFSRIDYGLGISSYRLSDASNEFTMVQGNLQMGFNLPVVYLSKEASVGLSPNVGIEAPLFGEYGSMLSLYAPAYATIKYGTDAAWSSTKSKVGFTVGIGYRYMTGVFPESGFTLSYGLPAYMVEFNFGKRRNPLMKVRFSSTFGEYTRN